MTEVKITVSLHVAIHTMHVYFIFLTRVTVIETLIQCLYMVYMSIYTYVYLHVSGIVQCAAYYIGYIMRFCLKFVNFIRVFLQSSCLLRCKIY